MKKLLLAVTFCLFSTMAFAQCNGIFPPNYVCGNASGVPAPPEAFDASSLATSKLVVGSTQIQNGINTYVEFNQNGVLGEYSVPGGFSGFGTAAGAAIGTTGATLGLLNANKTDSGTDTFSGTVNFIGTLEVGGVAALPWSVPNGGTGAVTFTSGVPILGNGTSPFTSGTKTGNTTLFATSNGSLVNGHCVSIDSNGNFIDAGGACTTGGGGGTVSSATGGQLAYYAASGTTVAGLTLGTGLSITGTTLNGTTIGGLTGAVLLGNGLTSSSNTINTLWTASGSNISNNNAGSVTVGSFTVSGVGGTISGTSAFIGASDSGNSRSISLVTNQGGGFPALAYGNGTGTDWQIYDDVNNAGIHFYNGAERLAILANGNVGIGTVSPAYPLSVNGESESGVTRGYADIRYFGATPPVCVQGSPTSLNVAAAVIAAHTAGWTHFFMPAGCFLYTGDSAWTAHYTVNTIPSGFFFKGEDWQTSGISVCATYTGCTPAPVSPCTTGSNCMTGTGPIEIQNMFVMDSSCYNVDGGAFFNPQYCPVQELFTNSGSFNISPAYPGLGLLLNVGPLTNGTWNGTDQPGIAINQETQGDVIFSNDITTNTSSNFINFTNLHGQALLVHVDGKASFGNSSTIHSGNGMLQIIDAFGTCNIYPGTSNIGISCMSDQRLKDHITDATDQLGWLNSFHIRQFTVRADGEDVPAGVIAQEVQQTHPEMVHFGKPGAACAPGHMDGCLSVMEPSVWRVMKAMQEMQAEIVSLKKDTPHANVHHHPMRHTAAHRS
ncbi:MAG: tail fiber domain-containing protein [Candidatus Acidiferrum sp.]